MHPDTASAVRILQDRLRAAETRDFGRAERYEAALDDLVRNPHRSGPVGYLVRNASSYGLKRTSRRARIAPRHPGSPDGTGGPADLVAPGANAAQLRIELRDLLARAHLSDFDRRILAALLDGASAADVALATGVPVARIRVRISRARSRLRAA